GRSFFMARLSRFFLLIVLGWGSAPAGMAAPPDGVVRIASHGASASVIFTESGRTLLLTCGHAFGPAGRDREIQLDVPTPDPGQPKHAPIRLVAVDMQMDLALIELGEGPLPYVIAVAPVDYRAGPT